MTIQRDKPRSPGLGVIALVSAVVVVAAAGTAVYFSIASGSRAKETRSSVEPAEPVFVSTKPPRVLQTAAPAPVSPAAAALSPPASSPEEPVAPTMDQPFIEARRERRDTVWALQTESNVRDALAALRGKEVTLQSVQCASTRCTVEGTFGRSGRLEEIVIATTKVGLTRARFKRAKDGDGTTTFSGVLARKGYNLDGSPKEDVAKPL
jgi:hypothetical protein